MYDLIGTGFAPERIEHGLNIVKYNEREKSCQVTEEAVQIVPQP